MSWREAASLGVSWVPPIGVVGSAQAGRVEGGDVTRVLYGWLFSPAADDVMDAAAGEADDAANLAVGPAARQQVAQVAQGGFRCGIG